MSTETNIISKEKTDIKIKPPQLWKVVFLNDDKTPMDFVISILTHIFKHSEDKAKELTLEIHNTGSAVVGVFNYEIAEQKGVEATTLARANGFPLKVTIEEEV